jgi:carbonic anhydrase
MSTQLDELFDSNRRWAAATAARDPGFFTRLLAQQTPQYLWVGCSDSRVPANEILGLLPGDVFVHRNLANVVAHGDLNALAVMQFAVDSLKVRHIMVVGHYGCSGVRAALLDLRIGIADNWLRHVQDVRNHHRPFLDTLPDQVRQLKALCELNVLEQAYNVCQTTVVQDAWARGQSVVVHGWVYGLHNGLLQDVRMTVASLDDVAGGYGRALAAIHARHGAGLATLAPTAAAV